MFLTYIPQKVRMKSGLPELSDLLVLPASDFRKNYEIGRRIGNGAFSEVYLVRNRSDNQIYAAKLIDRTSLNLSKHMWRELMIHHKISHPHIIQLKKAYTTDRHLMLVLEYASHGDLFEWIKDAPSYTDDLVRTLIRYVVDVLEYLHNNNIVHRDIKPENILFTSSSIDSVKISDFGLSGIIRPDSLLFSCAGTPIFMAPEIIAGSGHGKACDMWSVGVLTYFLLSGSLPFDSPALFTLYSKITTGDYSFTSAFDAFGVNAKDFISRCLIIDQNKRITPEEAKVHPWLTESKTSVAIANRNLVLGVLNERRNLKELKDTSMTLVAASKLLSIAKVRPKDAPKENQVSGLPHL